MSDLNGSSVSGSKGTSNGASPSAAIAIRDNLSITHVAARRGSAAALAERSRDAFGLGLPVRSQSVEFKDLTIVWAAPDQWLFIQPVSDGVAHDRELAKAFKGLASMVDVSDSRVVVRVSGSMFHAALSKGMAIDLNAAVFKPGSVAITHVAHIGVIIRRPVDGDGYELMCARTYSAYFLDWLRRISAA